MIAVIDILVKRGDTKRHTFNIKDTKGAVVDISGWADFRLAVNSEKEPLNDTTEVEKMTGALSIDGLDGKVYFPPTGTIPVESYFYDAQANDANGEKVTFVEGSYKVSQDRTKD